MYTDQNLELIKKFLEKNRENDVKNYQEIQLARASESGLSEECTKLELGLNNQLAATTTSLSDIEALIRDLPRQVHAVAKSLLKSFIQPVNPIESYRSRERELLQNRDRLLQELRALEIGRVERIAKYNERLLQLEQNKSFIALEYEAILFWLDRHAGKPFTNGLKRLEHKVLSGAKDILKLSPSDLTLTGIKDFFGRAGGYISDEWKKLPPEVQMVLIVAAAIGLAYGAVYLLAGSGVQMSVSLMVSQQGLAINLLTYTVGGGIQVFPTLCGLVAGVAAWQEFHRQSMEKDFVKNQSLEAELRMKKEKEEFSREKAEELRQEMEAQKRKDNDNDRKQSEVGRSSQAAKPELSSSSPRLASPEPILEPQSSAQRKQTDTHLQPAAGPSSVITQHKPVSDPDAEKEKQLLNTVELLYKDATTVMSYVAPIAGNIMIIGKALLESDSIGEPHNPYQKIIDQAIDEVVGIIIRDPYAKKLLDTVKEHAAFIWGFIGDDVEKKIKDKNVISQGNSNTGNKI